MNFIKSNFLYLVIGVLVVLLIIGRCSRPKNVEEPTIVRDTIWSIHESFVYSKPTLINTITPGKVIKEIRYLPDSNYDKLLKQYQDLLVLYLNKNVLKDSLKLDSIGFVYVTDTVAKNLISSRSYYYTLKYPKIIETITLPSIRRNQFYIGGGIGGTTISPVNQISAGILLKNRKDQIFGVYTGVTMNGQLGFGVQSYWKISFRK